MQEKNAAAIKAAAETVKGLFSQKDFGPQLAWSIIQRRGKDDRPCLKWSITNYLIMVFVGRTNDARTYKQFLNAEHPRQVCKGAHAFKILGPIIIKEEDKAAGKKTERLVGFRSIPVFRVQDTVLLNETDVEEYDYTPEILPELSQQIIKVLRDKWNVSVEYRPPERPGVLGYFRAKANDGKGAIVISEENSDAVLAHETMHFLNSLKEDLDTMDNARAELIAELGATIILNIAGIKGYEEQAVKYMMSYIGENTSDKEVLSKLNSVLTVTEKCVQRLLDAIDEAEEISAPK